MSRLTAPPTNEPITLDQVKANSGITHTTDDAYINDEVIPQVRDYVEQSGRLALTKATWQQSFDEFPRHNYLWLDRWPAQMVVNIDYTDTGGDPQTMPGTDYSLTPERAPPAVILNAGKTWPTALRRPGMVVVVFDAGFGDDWQAVPKSLHRACLMLASYWYAQREAFVQGTVDRDLALSLENLIRVGGGQTRYA